MKEAMLALLVLAIGTSFAHPNLELRQNDDFNATSLSLSPASTSPSPSPSVPASVSAVYSSDSAQFTANLNSTDSPPAPAFANSSVAPNVTGTATNGSAATITESSIPPRSSDPSANATSSSPVSAQSQNSSSNNTAYSPPYQYPLDTSLPNNTVHLSPKWQAAHARARNELSSWTLQEKVNLTTGTGWQIGRCVGNIPAIPSQGFPGLCLEDSPLGVRFADFVSAFPAGINVAST